MPELAALLLAAGAGRRFGGNKLLAPLHGQPLILHALALAEAATPGAVHVVLGAQRDIVAQLLPAGVHRIEHAGWAEGLGSSLAAGIAGLRETPAGVLVLLADQVALRPEALQALAGRWRAAPDAVHCAVYGGQPGVPAIFPCRLFAELATLRGVRGAKPLLLRETSPATRLAMPEAAIDIDHPDDLRRWLAGATA